MHLFPPQVELDASSLIFMLASLAFLFVTLSLLDRLQASRTARGTARTAERRATPLRLI